MYSSKKDKFNTIDNDYSDILEKESHFFDDFFTIVDGSFDEYNSDEIKYPIIISEAKAKTFSQCL